MRTDPKAAALCPCCQGSGILSASRAEVGLALRAMRTDRKMTLRGVANKLGVSHSMISYLESGRQRLSFYYMKCLARTYKMTPRRFTLWIVNYVEEMKK